MSMRHVVVCLCLLVNLFAATAVFASELGAADYKAYYGDVNGDGTPDLYLKAQPQILILHGDIAVPLALDPKGPNLLATGYTVNGVTNFLSLQSYADVDVSGLSATDFNYYSGDFNGDGLKDAFVQSNNNSKFTLIIQGVAGTGVPTVLQSLDSNLVASNVGTVKIEDHNNDGKDDVVVYKDGESYAGYLSSSAATLAYDRIWHYGDIDTGGRPTAVGAIGGSHSVGNDGSASYSIPITLAPGVGGMQPQLSFVYSSNGGNGIMGEGWSLNGLSSISRCPTTIVDDGFVDGVDFDSNDRFCLDGQPLVAVNGTYGASGTEYRTQTETFSKIVSYGSAGSCVRNGTNVPGPEKFLITTKTGQTLEYGYTEDSRVEAVGCSDVLEWALNKQQDQYNNAVTYTYTEDVGEHTLAQIDYNQGVSRVEFEYIERQDKSSGYVLGTVTKSTLLLKALRSFEESILLREYLAAYKQVGIHKGAAITSLVECAQDQCLPSTNLVWSDEYSESYDSIKYNTPRATGSYGASGWSSQLGDANGDGLTDAIWLYGSVSGGGGTRVAVSLSNGDGTYAPVIYNTTKTTGNLGASGWSSQLGDANGDGLTDAIWLYGSTTGGGGTRVAVSLSNGDGTYAPVIYNTTKTTGNLGASGWSSLLGDANGDGLTDAIWLYGSTSGSGGTRVAVSLSNGDGTYAPVIYNTTKTTGNLGASGWSSQLGDANGDGLIDAIWLYGSVSGSGGTRVAVSLSNGDGTYAPVIYNTTKTTGNLGASGWSSQLGDANGDGLIDAIWLYGSTSGSGGTRVAVSLSKGDGTYAPVIYNTTKTTGNLGASGWSSQLGDANGDGLTDAIWLFGSSSGDGARVAVSLSEGDGTYGPVKYNTPKTTGSYGAPGWSSQLGDANGDGLTDAIWLFGSSSGGGARVAVSMPSTGNRNLASITNGFNVKTKFNYKLLTDNTIYTKGTESLSYPVAHVTGPMAVVESVKQSNGIGGESSTSYTYKGLKSHITGLGSLGFSEMVTKNDDTGIFTTVTFNQDYANRLQGSAERIVTNASGVITSDTQNTWQQSTIGSGSSKRYLPQLTQTTVTKRDLNGAFLHKEVNDYTDGNGDPAYDAYGNIERMVSKLYDEGDSLLRTTTTVNQYSNNTSNWFIGQLTRAEVTTAVTGRSARKKVSTWEYDGSNGRKLREQIRHPNTDAIVHQTAYGFDENGTPQVDSFGNNLAITVSGPDFASRTSKVSFDSSGRYPESKTNALNHSATTEYYTASDTSNGAFPGKPKVTTDANGLKTYSTYDSFGRTTSVTSAWGTSAAVTSSTSFNYCDASCPANAEYYIVNTVQGGASSRSYVDKLGRELRKGTQSKKTRSGASEFVYVDYSFNNLGQNTQVSEPYFESDGPQYIHSMTYDDLNRSMTTTRADGRIDAIIYNGLTRTSLVDINGKNQSKTEVRNPMNELVKVIDNANNELTYHYDSHGNLLQTVDPLNNTVSIQYDVLGRKTSMNDPDKGEWSYTYNSLGQLISQTNARNETTCNAYDVAGRLIKRIDNYQGNVSSAVGQVSDATNQCANDDANPELATWQYDTATGAALGKLHVVTGKAGYQQVHRYDDLGRPEESIKTVNGEAYSVTISYDAYSRPFVSTYPGASHRLQVKNVYNELGMLIEVRNAANEDLYYQLQSLDARGNVTNESYGNGVETLRVYDAPTGYLTDIASLAMGGGSINIQDLKFNFDDVGNLDYREDFLNNFREDFVYDNLNRLKQTNADFDRGGATSSIQTTNVSYDVLGNILSKTGVGTYKYGADCSNNGGAGFGPHAVCEISGGSIGTKNTSYTYDANGNMTTGDGRTIDYTLFDKPDVIVKGNKKTELSYGPDRARYFRRDTVTGGGTNGADKVTDYTYVGGLFEKVEFKNDGVTVNKIEERHFIGGFAIVTLQDRSGATVADTKTRYLHKDHLGSITAISDELGNIEEKFSFDAWGKRRGATLAEMEAEVGKPFASMTAFEKGNLTISSLALASGVTNKGFTGHEQMDGVGLIHMNGRVYDAEIGRFLSADPFVQDRTNLQGLNRYSYVENNPLSYTDPSGYFLSKLKKAFKKVFKAVKKAVSKVWKGIRTGVKSIFKAIGKAFNAVPGLQQVVSIVISIWCVPCAMALNAAVSLANGASVGSVLKGLAVAYVTAGIANGVASSFASTAGQLASRAVVSGVVAKAQGGKFVDGVKGFAAGVAVGAAVGAAVKWAMGGESKALQEVDGNGSDDSDSFKKNEELSDNITFDDEGNVTIKATVSAEVGQEATRDIFIERVNGSETVKGGCNVFGFSCSKEYKLTIDLSAYSGSGVGDLHVVSRSGLASVNAKFAKFLSDPNKCQFACAAVGGKHVYINDIGLSGNKLRHELFHNIGFKHGNRAKGDFMHTNSGRLKARHIEEMRQHFGN